MFTSGRVCVKIAGRDAGKKCVVVDVLDSHFVLVDGETRRRKVNVRHLEPTTQVLEIRKGASHETVKEALSALGVNVRETKPKVKKEKPRHVRKVKTAPVEEKKAPKKKAVKKKEAQQELVQDKKGSA